MDALIEQTLQDLIDDYERQDNKLEPADVERLLDKRNFTPEQSLLIYSELSKRGINISFDEFEEPQDVEDTDEPQLKAEDYDLLGAFLREAGRSKLLTREEEVQLGRAIFQGTAMQQALTAAEVADGSEVQAIITHGIEARDKMIKSNLRLVVNVAKQFKQRSDLDLLDLIQEGMIGLMKAVEGFDHTKGFKFSTYAIWWIRQSVGRAIDDKGATIRVPVHMSYQIRRFRRARNMLATLRGSNNVSLQDIARELGTPFEDILPIYQASMLEPLSLDAPTNDDNDLTLKDMLVSGYPGPDSIFDNLQLSEKLEEILSSLTPRQADIIKRRFGFDGKSGVETLEQIAVDYKITRERVRQIEAVALKKLQHPVRSRKVRSFLEGER